MSNGSLLLVTGVQWKHLDAVISEVADGNAAYVVSCVHIVWCASVRVGLPSACDSASVCVCVRASAVAPTPASSQCRCADGAVIAAWLHHKSSAG